jgi:hypothetical protein
MKREPALQALPCTLSHATDAIFFTSYVKLLLNPFYEPNTAITSPSFDARIKALVKKHL